MEILFRKKGLAVSLLIRKQSVFTVKVGYTTRLRVQNLNLPRGTTFQHLLAPLRKGGCWGVALILHVKNRIDSVMCVRSYVWTVG